MSKSHLNSRSNYLKSDITIYLLLALSVFIFYGSSLSNSFVHDDIWQIAQNKYITSFQYISKIFSSCIAEDLLGGCSNRGFYYRPLQSIGYLITSQFSSSPQAFHLFNLIYYIFASSLVFILFKLLKISRFYAFLGALLFIVNPVNSEAVNWVSATPELLLTVFTLTALIFYIKFLNSKKPYQLILSALFFMPALLSKETAVFLIWVLPVYALIFLPKKTFKQSIFKLLILLVPFLSYLFIRSSVLGRVIYKYEGFYNLNSYQQILTALDLLPKYLLKLVIPSPLSFQPLLQPVLTFNPEVLLGIFSVILISILIYWLWVKNFKKILFGLIIILSGILPVLIFVNKLGEFIFSERYLLFSTIGFSLVVAEISSKLYLDSAGVKLNHPGGVKWKQGLVGVFLIYLGFSWWVVFSRNKDWKDNFTSYSAMIRVDPNHKKAHLELGELYKAEGQIEPAKEEYNKALIIDPTYPEANLALNLVANSFNKNGLNFYYPKGWKLEDESGKLTLTQGSKQDDIIILIKQDNLNRAPKLEDYLSVQTDSYGRVINQGLAKIPNTDLAYVKVWNDNSIKKLQFFLFKGSKVVQVLVYPADSPSMKQFDAILGSIKIQ